MTAEIDQLKQDGKPLGLFIGRHCECRDPRRCYYVAYEGRHDSGIIKFATADQVRKLFAQHVEVPPVEVPAAVESKADVQFSLNNEARGLGLFVGIHKRADNPEHCYFVMKRREYPGQRMPSLLKFADEQEVREFLRDEAEWRQP